MEHPIASAAVYGIVHIVIQEITARGGRPTMGPRLAIVGGLAQACAVLPGGCWGVRPQVNSVQRRGSRPVRWIPARAACRWRRTANIVGNPGTLVAVSYPTVRIGNSYAAGTVLVPASRFCFAALRLCANAACTST